VWHLQEAGDQVQAQVPDARSILNLQLQIDLGQSAAGSEASVNSYLQAGAWQEAHDGLQLRLASNPHDPYAEAVLVELACWDPTTYTAGLAAAQAWLATHDGALYQPYVQTRQDWLVEKQLHHDQVQGAAWGSRLYPVLAVFLALWVAKLSLALATRWTRQ
jgi:alpha-D-ribose 1-methylphosphonate 5-triphosphate synthase subunit PhnH